MNILYLGENSDPKSGWGRYALDIVEGVESFGHNVVLLTREKNSKTKEIILRRGLGLFISAWQVRKIIRNFDIVHALDLYPYGIIASLANIGLNKKVIITAVGTYAVAPLYHFKTSFLARWACRKASVLVAISHFTKNEILKKIKKRNIQVINPRFDFEKFYRECDKKKENFILGVGALKKRKGYHVSIPAFALARRKIPGLRYIIIGSQKDKKYFNYLKKIAKDYGVRDSVKFLEGISDKKLINLYCRARLFILTSINHNHHFEGYGLVFLEAAAAGLPVVGTLNNGISDAVRDGFNGLLVPQDNIKKAKEAIVKILLNKNKESQFKKNAYLWAKKQDKKEMIKEYLKCYGL